MRIDYYWFHNQNVYLAGYDSASFCHYLRKAGIAANADRQKKNAIYYLMNTWGLICVHMGPEND